MILSRSSLSVTFLFRSSLISRLPITLSKIRRKGVVVLRFLRWDTNANGRSFVKRQSRSRGFLQNLSMVSCDKSTRVCGTSKPLWRFQKPKLHSIFISISYGASTPCGNSVVEVKIC